MIHYQAFSNYTDFKDIFGMNEHGNGVKSRNNKILLNYLKNPKLLHYCNSNNMLNLLSVKSMAELQTKLIEALQKSSEGKKYRVQLIDMSFYSDTYETDNKEGVCEDGDTNCVRYRNHETDGIYKMKAGKFLRKLIEETELGQALNDSTIVWLCEEFTTNWNSYSLGSLPENKLHVNDNFGLIYDSRHLKGNFHSCMVDRGRSEFYRERVKAKAAYLTNKDNEIIARCIVFTEAKDKNGKIWRLAERQYSSEGNLIYQRVLIDKLIQGGYIDGYKKIGAGCGESRAFVDNTGRSLENMVFCVEMNPSTYDICSYQDSFKYYNYDNEVAYNIMANYDYILAFTSVSIEADENEESDYAVDTYHDDTCDHVRLVYVNGKEEFCDSDYMEDFKFVNGEYHHKDDVLKCPKCGEYYLKKDKYHSDKTGKDYDSRACLSLDEALFEQEHPVEQEELV